MSDSTLTNQAQAVDAFNNLSSAVEDAINPVGEAAAAVVPGATVVAADAAAGNHVGAAVAAAETAAVAAKSAAAVVTAVTPVVNAATVVTQVVAHSAVAAIEAELGALEPIFKNKLTGIFGALFGGAHSFLSKL